MSSQRGAGGRALGNNERSEASTCLVGSSFGEGRCIQAPARTGSENLPRNDRKNIFCSDDGAQNHINHYFIST